MNDDELAKLYEDPANRRTAGRPSRRPLAREALNSHVPIRFSAATMASVQALAHGDGMTVSAWIRSIVDRELVRRMPPQTVSTLTAQSALKESIPSNQPQTIGVAIQAA